MIMPWFIPLAIGVGYEGTKTSLRSRHLLKSGNRERDWWILLVLAWLPSFCWIVSQFIEQY